jgi:demethylmenaquinone methyltransferase/2-methoxy-6-polyprenyl-1,4-benzoquinol methylase
MGRRLVGFFWSHIPHASLDGFLGGLMSRLEPGAVVVLVDNRYVAGSNHPLTRTDAEGNTFQRRTLDDGSDWEVLKNFPSPEELTSRLGRHGDCELLPLRYYWAARVVSGDV